MKKKYETINNSQNKTNLMTKENDLLGQKTKKKGIFYKTHTKDFLFFIKGEKDNIQGKILIKSDKKKKEKFIYDLKNRIS